MANELRVREDFVSGLVEDNPLTSSATTLTSADLADLPAIGSTEHAVLIIDPDGTPEIVYVTAHTASATTATIARGKEGTTGVEHVRDTPWIHGPVVSDQDGNGAGLIGLTEYDPGTLTTQSTTSTTGVDLDATNLKVDFVAPPSGKVLVVLDAAAYMSNINNWGQWGLHDGTADVAGSWLGFAATHQIRHSYRKSFTGLTPGTSYSWRWRHRVSNAATQLNTQYGGNGTTAGAATMEVWAVNV